MTRTQTYPFIYILSLAAFMCQWWRWVLMTNMVWSTETKLFTIYSFMEEVCWPLSYTVKMQAIFVIISTVFRFQRFLNVISYILKSTKYSKFPWVEKWIYRFEILTWINSILQLKSINKDYLNVDRFLKTKVKWTKTF